MAEASDRTIPATARRREAARRAGLSAPAELPAWAASAATAIALGPWWARTTLAAAADGVRETFTMTLGAGAAVQAWPLPLAAATPTLAVVALQVPATCYYLPGSQGWESTYSGRPTQPLGLSMAGGSGGTGVGPAGFHLVFAGAPGLTVVIEASSTLRPDDWVAVGEVLMTSNEGFFDDAGWFQYNGRFYRLRVR